MRVNLDLFVTAVVIGLFVGGFYLVTNGSEFIGAMMLFAGFLLVVLLIGRANTMQ